LEPHRHQLRRGRRAPRPVPRDGPNERAANLEQPNLQLRLTSRSRTESLPCATSGSAVRRASGCRLTSRASYGCPCRSTRRPAGEDAQRRTMGPLEVTDTCCAAICTRRITRFHLAPQQPHAYCNLPSPRTFGDLCRSRVGRHQLRAEAQAGSDQGRHPVWPHPNQLLDLYLPPKGDGPFPVVIWFGGLWKPAKHVPPLDRFFPAGCAAASVQDASDGGRDQGQDQSAHLRLPARCSPGGPVCSPACRRVESQPAQDCRSRKFPRCPAGTLRRLCWRTCRSQFERSRRNGFYEGDLHGSTP